ncbi:N-formylglutamate deformylase [Acidocella aquatica]|uniref:N-formylglutamate deformylase n=1 Tax=Acidocella aquatica TaxID=1922313 RepID=A0ABQ6A472_9PROT|nr:N-formylglutamate deformylase [Acidocella aquatica]GLR67269.1 N-formylglutamate deformylase [Acidocella aquatica]
MSFISIRQGSAPLILSIPHAGTEIPESLLPSLVSPWLARKDADWWLPELYAFAEALDATVVRTRISRTVIDVNRDPSGVSLYPGQATTGLCPTETFDGEPLYVDGHAPNEAEILLRRVKYFDPYHEALAAEITRLRRLHHAIVLYDCHSIRSEIPRLFQGVLPNFNIGTNDDKACDAAITDRVAAICEADERFSRVVNGRFKGGYITRHYGDPEEGINALQMELACRGYMEEPAAPTPENWPSPFNPAPPILQILKTILESFIP